MTQGLKPYSAPVLKDWGKVAELTLSRSVSAFGGGKGSKCNQGVGNGPEGCDPGNSNNKRPSNDENGGRPGNPGRGGGRGGRG